MWASHGKRLCGPTGYEIVRAMIRDFRIGATIRIGFSIWLRNIVPFTFLTAIVYSPLVVWVVSLASGPLDPRQVALFGAMSAGVVMLLGIMLTGALTYGVVMELRGERASLLSCVGVGLRRFFPVLGVSLLSILAIAGGTLLLIVPGLILTCMLYVSVPASIVERPGVFGALRRSRALTAGNRWAIFGLFILIAIANAVLAVVVQRVFLEGGVIDRTPVERLPAYLYAELARILLTAPLASVFPAVAYFLLREEREGVSAAQLARVFE